MAGTFPKLSTNAVAQYPASRNVQFRNQVLRFVDGATQRYRESFGPLHQWDIRLDQLDEREMAAIERFFAGNQGCFGNFEFTDPWDGQVYPSCSFASDALGLVSAAEMNGRTSFTVRQNRG
jgi:hypothetical protein